MKVVELRDGAAISGPGRHHAKVGQNGDPQSKAKAFKQALDSGIGNEVDIALMKFCFWDIRHETDIDAVFEDYRSTMAELTHCYPCDFARPATSVGSQRGRLLSKGRRSRSRVRHDRASLP